MNFVSGETAEMAAQETLHGHHNVHYAQNDPAAPNSYNYHFGMHPDEGPFPGHYNSYLGQQQSHYGEAMMQHHGEPYENMGHHSNYPTQGSNFNNDAHMHYAQSHASMPHNGNPYGQHHMMDNMQHNSHYLGMMPPGGFKEEPKDDPYSFVDEEQMMHQESLAMMPGNIKTEPGMGMNPLLGPKKRGRKKKNSSDVEEGNMNPLPLTPDGSLMKRKYTKSEHYKQRRKHDRFNGMSEEEVRTRTLPDHLIPNLDVVIIGINPGLFAAYKGHHYAGPGNHFWKCMFLAGLVPEPMTADDDYKLLHYGIGFTNMVARATKGSADLTRREIRDGVKILLEKLQRYRPKVAVFNGKGIYEVFSGKKEFLFGRQPEFIDGTNTYIWVMPSSSARCAQLPRAMDKVPFYTALKKFRDYLNGLIPSIDDSEVVFNDPKIRAADDGTEISEHLKYDTPTRQLYSLEAPAKDTNSVDVPQISDSNGQPVVVKKKRGRPKKIRTEEGNIPKAEFSASSSCSSQPYPLPGGEVPLDGPPKKKRGRPKKIRPEEQMKTNPGPMGEVPAMVSHQSEMVNTHTPGPYHHPMTQDSYMNPQSQVGTPSFCNGSSATPSPVHGSMGTTEQCVGSSQPSISSPMTNQEFEGVSNPGEPGSVNTAATVPVTPSTTTATTPMSTALGPSSASSQNESCNETANSDRENFTQYHTNNTNPQTPSNTPGATGASEQPQQQQQQQQQQQHDQPPANYRPPTSSGPGYPVPNQDIAARSLSGLESLVDQIPNMGSDEHGQISGHAHGLAYGSQYAPPPSSYSGPYPVTGNYAQYTGAYSGGGPGSGPGFTYSSGSHAPMEPHYSNPAAPYPHLVPGGAMFPPGANMNGMPGFPYSYNQYPPAGPQSSSFPYSSPVQNPGYPYPATSSAYGHPYPQPGYFNNQVLDRLKQQPDPRDMNYGSF